MSLLPIALGVASGRSIVSTYYSATRKNEVHREVASFAHLVIPTTKAYYKAYRALNAIPEVINSEYGSYWLQPGKIQLVCVGHLLLHGISALTSGPNGPRDTTGYGGGSRNYSKDHDSRLPVLISRIAPVVLVIAQLGLVYLDYRRGETMKATVTVITCGATVLAHNYHSVDTLLNAVYVIALGFILLKGSNFKRLETLYKVAMYMKG